MDTQDAAMDTTHAGSGFSTGSAEKDMGCAYGVDFGTGAALAIYGPSGLVAKRDLRLPRVKGGRTPAMEFPMVVDALMSGDNIPAGDVVVESPTLGSSGCEIDDVISVLARHPGRALWTISARAVKNWRADHPGECGGWRKGARYVRDGAPPPVTMTIHEQADVHIEDAEIIFRIATEHPERLQQWVGKRPVINRIHTSVRPMDKRGYRDDRSEEFMSLLPPFKSLPAHLQDVLGVRGDYSRSMVMPFAMALTEPHIADAEPDDRRRAFEAVIGLGDNGYPSFYRRATVVWMQEVARGLAGVTRIGEVPPSVRKEAWRITQRQIRELFHLSMKP